MQKIIPRNQIEEKYGGTASNLRAFWLALVSYWFQLYCRPPLSTLESIKPTEIGAMSRAVLKGTDQPTADPSTNPEKGGDGGFLCGCDGRKGEVKQDSNCILI